MARFIVRRMITAVIIVFFLSIATFIVLGAMPGSPCQGWMTKEQCEALKEERGYNRPLFPVSIDPSNTGDWWLLAVPAAGVLAGAVLLRRRPHAADVTS
jgi:hypothetical protein